MMPVGFSVGGHVDQPGFPAEGASQGPGLVDLFQEPAAVLEQPLESHSARQGGVVEKNVYIFPAAAGITVGAPVGNQFRWTHPSMRYRP